MKLKIELKLEGNTISGRVLEQDEELRNDGLGITIIRNEQFCITSAEAPELRKNKLFVRGYVSKNDHSEFNKDFDTIEEAKSVYKTIINLVNELNRKIGGVVDEHGNVLYIDEKDEVIARLKTTDTDQSAKADAGKPNLTLVPTQIIRDIAEVREYGNRKYGSRDNWKNVELERYIAALYRHLLEMVEDPLSVDSESKIEHYKHIACNAAFICEMLKGEGKK